MKRAVCIILWALGGYVLGKIWFRLMFRVALSFMPSFDAAVWVYEVMKATAAILTGALLFLGLVGRLPGTRRAVLPPASS
jgi:hypothetical protein